jgi:uncharacterized membrane protein
MQNIETIKAIIFTVVLLSAALWFGFRLVEFSKKATLIMSILALVLGMTVGFSVHNHP